MSFLVIHSAHELSTAPCSLRRLITSSAFCLSSFEKSIHPNCIVFLFSAYYASQLNYFKLHSQVPPKYSQYVLISQKYLRNISSSPFLTISVKYHESTPYLLNDHTLHKESPHSIYFIILAYRECLVYLNHLSIFSVRHYYLHE